MSQLYARVFLSILDSSLAEDWVARHVFEDFLKLADGGLLDMTREAFSRRTNIPLAVVNEAISKLEAPDPASRDPAEEGRRIVRVDNHRDWGWRIVNMEKYELIHTKAEQRAKTAERVRKHRQKCTPPPLSPSPDITSDVPSEQVLQNVTECYIQPKAVKDKQIAKAKGTLSEIMDYCRDIGLPDSDADYFFNKWEGNGWSNGGRPIKDWRATIRSWKAGGYCPSQKHKPTPKTQAPALQEFIP